MKPSAFVFFIVSVLISVYSGCGSTPSNVPVEQTESPAQIETLFAVDSIGVLMGDSCYMLGSIADFTMFPGGNPAILDRVKGTVSVFNSAGVFLNSFGGFGEAPGEFQYPFGMARLSSGLVLVSEAVGNKINVFDENGSFVSSWTTDGLAGFPIQMVPFDDSTVVCYRFAMKFDDGNYGINYTLNRFDAVTGELLTEYFNWLGLSRPSTDFTPAYLVAASDGEGTLYVSKVQSEIWTVEVYGADPEPLDTISVFPDREREMAPDSSMIPGVLPIAYAFSDGDGNTEQSTVNMPEFHPFISALGVDGNGDLWCCRGGLPGNTWDVVSPEGEIVKQVVITLPDSAYYISTDVSPWGVLACDMLTNDFEKLYTIGN